MGPFEPVTPCGRGNTQDLKTTFLLAPQAIKTLQTRDIVEWQGLDACGASKNAVIRRADRAPERRGNEFQGTPAPSSGALAHDEGFGQSPTLPSDTSPRARGGLQALVDHEFARM